MSSRRRRRPRRHTNRRRQSTRAIAVRALRATDQERKFADVLFNIAPIDDASTTGSIFLLNGVGAGTANFQRLGKKLAMRSLYLQLAIEKNPAAATNSDYVRMMVVLDRQANEAAPIVSEILELTTPTNPFLDMWAPNNLANSKRFVTLYDHRMVFHRTFIEGRIVKKYLTLNQTVNYDNSGASIADLTTNSLWLVLIGSIATGGAQPSVTGFSRLRFVG